MNVKYLIGVVIETVVKVVVLVLVIMFVYRTAATAYDFGYRVFAEGPKSKSGGRIITVSISEDATVAGIGEMLQQKGLIEDANLFVMQELLSANHGKIKPGIYDLSTAMTAEEMLEIMSAEADGE